MADEKDLKKYGNAEESKTSVKRYPDYKADDWRKQSDEYRKEQQKTAPPRGSVHPLGALMDAFGYAQGGAVKKGSYTVPQMCGGGKVIKTWGK